MVDVFKLTIPQLTGDEERTAYVYSPEGVSEPCPVLYMFDGQNLFFDSTASFGKSWGLLKYLEETGLPLIVASVACNTHPESYHLGGRFSEYSPFSFHDDRFGDIKGRGEITMEWLINEFKPLIDSRYRTLPDRQHTFIGGSSMGGLMSLYAVSAYNRVFSRAAALSPSVMLTDCRIIPLIRRTDYAPGTVVYMDVGQEEEDGEDGRDGEEQREPAVGLHRA